MTCALLLGLVPGAEARFEPVDPWRAASDPWLGAHIDVPVPRLAQRGDKANCGPTAAAMVLGAYRGLENRTALAILRDALGTWSWDRFPLRSWHLPGYDPGMMTPDMLGRTLEHFGQGIRFTRLDHPVLPAEAFALPALRRALSEGRPVIVLVESRVLWAVDRGPGLHWVVVRGIEGDRVVYNDPGDAGVFTLPLARFWHAWRLAPLYQSLPGIDGFVAFVADQRLPGRVVLRGAAPFW